MRISKQMKRAVKIRTLLMIYQAFYGTLAANLKLVETKEAHGQPVETMATDGQSIFINPDFIAKLYDDEVLFVLAHEAGHCAALHHVRRGDREPELWNIAGDYVLNIDLHDASVGRMPEGGLLDFRFRGWSTEEVYDELLREQKKQQQKQQSASSGGQSQSQQDDASQKPEKGSQKPGSQKQQSDTRKGEKPASGQQSGSDEQDSAKGKGQSQGQKSDPGRCGQVLDAAAGAAEKAEQEADWQRITRQAVAVAKRAGTLPAGAELLLGELNKPRENWRETMRRFVDQSSTADYAWTRPDRRFACEPFMLPSLVSDGVHHVAVGFDTSGSIYCQPKLLDTFRSEMQALLDEGGVDMLTIIHCDSAVQLVETYEKGELIKMQAKGGGGTSYKPVWKHLAEMSETPAAVVYFTDLEPNDGFGEAPNVPVLWACYGPLRQITSKAAAVPFGEAVVVQED